MQDFSKPRVTTRAVIDETRKCSLRCAHCYYRPTDNFYSVNSWDSHKKTVMDAVKRGCDSCDITGGEPMESPLIVDLVKLCVDVGLYPRIITSLICKESTLDAVLDVIADTGDWLISMHGGKDETHNEIVQVPRARHFQRRRLAKIAERMKFCVNYVLLEQNQTEMVEWANWLLNSGHRLPTTANFINFNVFGDWLRSPEWIAEGTKNVVDLRICGPILDEAIDILEGAGIGVNVRYYPMCGLAERHRKSIANDLQVAFDFGEWDSGFVRSAGDRTLAVGERYARNISNHNELQTAPCSGCGLKQICGGANRIWHQLAMEKFGVETLTQLPTPEGVDPAIPYWHYRQHNVLGLDPRREAK